MSYIKYEIDAISRVEVYFIYLKLSKLFNTIEINHNNNYFYIKLTNEDVLEDNIPSYLKIFINASKNNRLIINTNIVDKEYNNIYIGGYWNYLFGSKEFENLNNLIKEVRRCIKLNKILLNKNKLK